MKRITSKVTYTVPHWNFCNSDNLVGGEITHLKCQFCHKTKDGYTCLLYNKELNSKGKYIEKVRECCKATAGFKSTIDSQQTLVEPQELMKQTIKSYKKAVNDLVSQGYPQNIADTLAQKIVLEQ